MLNFDLLQVSPLEALEEKELSTVIWNTTAYTIQTLGEQRVHPSHSLSVWTNQYAIM